MSFLTGTNAELLYASTAIGAALNTFTAEAALNTTTTMGVMAHLPPDFWLPNTNSVGRGIRVVARGIYSTTATAPTLTVFVRAGTAANTTGTILLGATLATVSAPVLTTTIATPGYWELQGDIVLTAIGATGANSTVKGVGSLTYGGIVGTATTNVWAMWGGAAGGSAAVAPGTATTLDTSITNYLNVNAACGTSNANNAITLESLIVWGLN